MLSSLRTVYLQEEPPGLVILDQTRLPAEFVYLTLTTAPAIGDAIARLAVRGAPAIGVAAALGLYVSAWHIGQQASLRSWIGQTAAYLEGVRPTAVNLSWALRRMCAALPETDEREALLTALRTEALAIWAEDRAVCRAIGEKGAPLITADCGVLTHCNAGALATAGMGTALAPLYTALEQGRRARVYCDETRPLLQGARLTAAELQRAGFVPTLLCDNMAPSLMASGAIDLVLVGCDRVARNGDTANKIGTLGVAILAAHYAIPFYVCAPLSTLDPDCADGGGIPVEEREGREVTEMWYKQPMAPEGINIYNPAFDVTPARLITGFITERGIVPPTSLGS